MLIPNAEEKKPFCEKFFETEIPLVEGNLNVKVAFDSTPLGHMMNKHGLWIEAATMRSLCTFAISTG